MRTPAFYVHPTSQRFEPLGVHDELVDDALRGFNRWPLNRSVTEDDRMSTTWLRLHDALTMALTGRIE